MKDSQSDHSDHTQHVSDTLSSTRHHWIYRGQQGALSVFEFLEQMLPSVPSDYWPERCAFGGIHVNGEVCTENIHLPNPSRIEYFMPKYGTEAAADYFPTFQSKFIIHQDPDLAIAFKHAGLPTLPSREQGHFTLKRYVEDHLNQTVHIPSRLDTATAGLVPISRS